MECRICQKDVTYDHYFLDTFVYCPECYENKIRFEQRDAALEHTVPLLQRKQPLKRKRF